MLTTESSEKFFVYERLAGSGAVIDRENGVIRGVKVIGFESANGRVYPPAVLRAAVPLYESAPVFIDHTDKATGRKYGERFGSLKNARFVEGDGIRADHHFNPKHPLAEQYLWDAEHAPESVGFSHTAKLRFAMKADAQGRAIVEEIGEVLSVDLVAEPATTKGLFESTNQTKDDDMNLSKITVEELVAARPDLVQTAGAHTIKLLTKQIARLQKENDAYATQAAIVDELKAAGLDPANKLHVSDFFMGQLADTKDTKTRQAMIDDRAALIQFAAAQANAADGESRRSIWSKPTTSPAPGQPPARRVKTIFETLSREASQAIAKDFMRRANRLPVVNEHGESNVPLCEQIAGASGFATPYVPPAYERFMK